MSKKEPKAPKTDAGPSEDKYRLDDIEVKRRQSDYKKFTLPTAIDQLKTVIQLEFKQYFKGAYPILLYILAVLIPVLQICNVDVIGLVKDFISLMSGGAEMTSLQYLHYTLILMPTVMVLAMAMLCGKTISQEYEGKTCFLNLPLPVERRIFFTGKFIAISITAITVVLVGYGASMIDTNMHYGTIAIDPVIESLAIGIFVMLAFVATGMFFSSICKKRGGIIVMCLMMFIIPAIPVAVALVTNDTSLSGIWDIFLYTPPFATDTMLTTLGWDPTMSLSGFAIGNLYKDVATVVGTILASLAWTVIFFAAGLYMFNRRQV